MCSDRLNFEDLFNFYLQNKNFRFSEFMEHTFSSKQIVSKVTRKYESLLDLAFLKVYPAKFDQVSDYRLSRASSWYYVSLVLFVSLEWNIFRLIGIFPLSSHVMLQVEHILPWAEHNHFYRW
jgi:hypothetical protein